ESRKQPHDGDDHRLDARGGPPQADQPWQSGQRRGAEVPRRRLSGALDPHGRRRLRGAIAGHRCRQCRSNKRAITCDKMPPIQAAARRVDSRMMPMIRVVAAAAAVLLGALSAGAQTLAVTGVVRDETGGALPGVTVEAHGETSQTVSTATDAAGAYRLDLPI